MINLKNDYCYIAHPQIMEKLNQHFDIHMSVMV